MSKKRFILYWRDLHDYLPWKHRLVENPEIRISNTFLDFGTGFYTTTSRQQAERWARIKMRRENKNIGYVSVYEFDFERAQQETTIRRFSNADMQWLQYVVKNRRGETSDEIVDMHIGPVADEFVESIEIRTEE